jgi:glutaminyl-peptide cyclotransferase
MQVSGVRCQFTRPRYAAGGMAGILVLTIFLFSSCDNSDELSTEPIPKIDAKYAFSLVKELSAIKPRYSGSGEGTRKAVELISREIRNSSLSVELDKWQEPTSEGIIEFWNVMTEIPGKSSDFILIGSHYDTKKMLSIPDFEGANDSASSTGLLLAMIKAIKNHPARTPLTLKFAFFDGEECFISYTETDGLFGSRHLAEKWKRDGSLKKCKAVIILDMVGDKDLNITIPSGADPEIVKKLKQIAEKQNKIQYLSEYGNDIIDDHTPFQREGIPTLDIIDFEFGEGNMYWHTKADSMDKISKESLETVGDLTLELLWNVD